MITKIERTAPDMLQVTMDGEVFLIPDTLRNRLIHGITDWVAAGGVIEVASSASKSDLIDAERDRRTDAGFLFNGVLFQSRPVDRENIAGAATAALGAIIAGAQPGDYHWAGSESEFVWIANDNSLMHMDAHTTFMFGQAAMAHKQQLIFKARALKDMSPIPHDYADDSYW